MGKFATSFRHEARTHKTLRLPQIVRPPGRRGFPTVIIRLARYRLMSETLNDKTTQPKAETAVCPETESAPVHRVLSGFPANMLDSVLSR